MVKLLAGLALYQPDTDGHRPLWQQAGVGNLEAQPFGNLQPLHSLGAGEHQNKAIFIPAGEGIFAAQLVAHDARQFGQHGVTGSLAKELADFGHVIDRKLQQTEASSLGQQPLLQQLLEAAATLQPGQRIGAVPLFHQHDGGIEMAHHAKQMAPLVTADPLFQPDVVAVVVKNAIFEAQTAAAAALAGAQGISQPGNVIGMHPLQPAEIIRPAIAKPQQAQAGRVAAQSLLRGPCPDPRLQQRHGIEQQTRIKPGGDIHQRCLEHFHGAPRNRI